MRHKLIHTKKINFIILVFVTCIQIGCNKVMSVFIEDKNTGFNGSFETIKDNFPVNWILYTPQTVPNADFDLKIDNKDFIDGKQSLHFDIRRCDAIGGWQSPGLSKETPSKSGETYKVSFWLKNNQTEFVVKAGGVSELNGKLDIIIQSKEQIDSWKKFEFTCSIPQNMNTLRLEVNVLQPGDFWIDNVNIENIN